MWAASHEGSLTTNAPWAVHMHLRAFLGNAAPRSRGLPKVTPVTPTAQSLRAALPPEKMHHKLLCSLRCYPAPGGAPRGCGRPLFRYIHNAIWRLEKSVEKHTKR